MTASSISKRPTGADGFTKVPDIAEAFPEPTNDGKTYVFKIRKGIMFSNGKELGVKDVVASLQRIFKVSSPTAGGFYSVIVGADKCLKDAKTCTLEGGVVGDEAAGTVTINLTRPDAEIFDKLALPHAVILPADSPTEDVGSNPLPGTGAYMISAYDPNKGMTLSRNPHFKVWSEQAQPDGYPDVVQYDFGLTEEAQVTAVQNGEADWMFDEPPADRLAEMGTKNKDQVHVTPLTAWWYVPMNTRLAPFDNVKVRQAVNFAIDRKQLVNLFGGPVLAAPVCQVLPPGFPGHEDYCPYTKDPGTKWSAPDMEKAKQLVEESGTKGQKVTIIAEDKAVSKSIGVYLQSVMTELGYDTDVKPISSNIQFTYIQNTNNKVQMSITQWYQDYPAASDFLNILFGCSSFTEGSDSSINIAGFCDKDIDAKMQAALALGVTDPDSCQQGMGCHRQGGDGQCACCSPVYAKASRLRVKAVGQFPVQLAILLHGHAGLGSVTGAIRDGGNDCNAPREPWSLGHGHAAAGARQGRHGGLAAVHGHSHHVPAGACLCKLGRR